MAPQVAEIGTMIANSGSGSTISVTPPSADWSTDDIIAIFLYIEQGSGASQLNPPSGFARAGTSAFQAASGSCSVYVYWRRSNGSESSNITVPVQPSAYRQCAAVRITGADTSSPWDDTATAVRSDTAQGSLTTTPAVSADSTVNNCLAVIFFGTYTPSRWSTMPTGFTELPSPFFVDDSATDPFMEWAAATRALSSPTSLTSLSVNCGETEGKAVWLGIIKPAAADTVPPGEVYDLERWHLTTPAEDPADGDAEQIDQPELDDYSSEYLYLDEDGLMVCEAPVNGFTTSGESGATRTEFREHETNYANSAWNPATTGRRQLTITVRVDGTQITGTAPARRQEVTFLQIHGATGTPPLYLTGEYTTSGNPLPGDPRVRLFLSGTGMANTNALASITPDTDISVRVRVQSAVVKLWIVAGQATDLPPVSATPSYQWNVSAFTDRASWYYKYGAYNKTLITAGASGAGVVKVSHVELLQPSDPEPPAIVGGTAAVTLGALSVAATGAGFSTVPGTAAVTTGALSVAATGTRTTNGTAAVTLEGVSVTAAGTAIPEVVTGVAAIALDGLSVAAAGGRTTFGTGTVAFGGLDVTAAGNRTTSGTGVVTLGDLIVDATGTVIAEVVTGTAGITLEALTIAAVGQRTTAGTATVSLAPLDVQVVGDGVAQIVTGVAAVELGALDVQAASQRTTFGTAGVTLAEPTITVTGTVIAEVISGSAAVTLAPLTISATGQRVTAGTAAITLAALDVQAFGDGVAQIVTGTASVSLGGLTVAAQGLITTQGTISVTLGGIAVAASGTRVVSGAAAVSLAGLVVTATQEPPETVTGTAEIALAGLVVVAVGYAVVPIPAALIAGAPTAVRGPSAAVPTPSRGPIADTPTPLRGPSAAVPTPSRGPIADTPTPLRGVVAGVPSR